MPRPSARTRLPRLHFGVRAAILSALLTSLGLMNAAAGGVTVPGVPGYVTAKAVGTRVLVTWNAPANGGAPITAYYVYANGNKVCTNTRPSCTVTGLPVAVAYRFTVAAHNRVGTSRMSTPSYPAMPYTKAGAPTVRIVTLQHNALSVNFDRPPTNGGSAVRSYDYSLNGGKTWKHSGQSNSPLKITGVTDGHSYTVTMRAVNQAGFGKASSTYSATRVAFFGDSLVWGQGASAKPSWSRQVAQSHKWQQINFGVRGTGFNKPNVATTSCTGFKNVPSLLHCAVPYHPNIVVISAGINDCDYVSAHPVQTKQSVQTTLSRAKSMFPQAQILITGVVTFTAKQCWTTLNGWIADAAQASGAHYADGAATWVLGRTEMQVDGVHPNDLGHTQIANSFNTWYASLPK